MTRLMSGEQLQAYGALVRNLPAHPINREFGDLPADAGEHIRQDLVPPYVGASSPQPSKASGQTD